ncbi:hypothetical protein PTKIN_Ptkin08bG0123700 [Pterospermum kingtungense]
MEVKPGEILKNIAVGEWENPLMRCTSTGDPVGDSALSSDSEEGAKSFAERHG